MPHTNTAAKMPIPKTSTPNVAAETGSLLSETSHPVVVEVELLDVSLAAIAIPRLINRTIDMIDRRSISPKVLPRIMNDQSTKLLKQAIEERCSRNNDIIISFCNYAYTDFIRNLAYCFQRLSITNYLFIALDANAYHTLDSLNYPVFLFEKDGAVYTQESSNFGEVGFKAICNEKPFLVWWILKMGFNVLWTDSDIVWLSNPMNAFPSGFDLYIQMDDDDVCAGFYFIKHSVDAVTFMEKVVRYLNPMIDDQISMRRFLKDDDHGLNVHILPRHLFPNGSSFFNLKIPQRASITPVIVHNNCIIGHRSKKDRFINYGMWFIDDDDDDDDDDRSMKHEPTLMEPLSIMTGHHDVITSIAYRYPFLYSSSFDKELMIWKRTEEDGFKLDSVKYLHSRGCISSLLLDGDSLYTSSHDRTATSWNLDSFQPRVHFKGHSMILNHLAVSSSSKMVFSASDDGTIRSYDIETGDRIRVFVGHSSWVTMLKVSSKVLFSCGKDGTVRAWDINSAKCLEVYKLPDRYAFADVQTWVRSIEMHPSMTHQHDEIYSGSSDGTIIVWDVKAGTVRRKIKAHQGGINAMRSVMRDAKVILLSGGDDGMIKRWDVASGELLLSFRAHEGAVSDLLFDPTDSSLLFSSGWDKLIKLWRLK